MFLDYEKRRIRCRLISCFPPAHRIRICLQDRFGFRPPPSHHRAQARGGIFRPSYELCRNHTLCSNLFRTRDRLIRTLRVRGGSVLHCTPRLRGDANPARLVRSLRSRAKPKNFPSLFLIFGGGCGGSRQKMERKFLVLLRRFQFTHLL